MNSITYSENGKNYIACKKEINASQFTIQKILNPDLSIWKHIVEYSKPNSNRIRFEITTSQNIELIRKINDEDKIFLKNNNILFREDVNKPDDYYENYPIEEQVLAWEVNSKEGQEKLIAIDNRNTFYTAKATTKKHREDYQSAW